MITLKHSDGPRIKYGGQTDYKRFYHSDPMLAFKKEVTMKGGFGNLPAGTPIAKVTGDGGSKEKYVPYNPATISSAVKNTGQAFLVQDADGTTGLFVTMDDSYKFVVGDQVYIADNNSKTSSSEDLGVITAIDRTTYLHMAKITTTSAATISTFTTAQSAALFHEAGADNANTWSDCAGILDVDVDTGIGEDAMDGIGTAVFKNAIIHAGVCPNVDSTALTDLSATKDGNYIYL
jgi:hypothetical protein